ncbi:alpha-lytic protease prodomain-containing protein [Catellatospora sp. KI3]|uniref:alpha-lytic protease prodomain-containing protein n=1 Tax=Catellatospora sp. KI3 TaxID=3041620 RepID=UPI00248255A6|nr:alpha-lytic protease prodomain-containing protein [Catellatospora sp. KI3]MDI1463164.1 alpha-lytic protease prodomain-containing protein [Catellatospora sp. KI3]
MNRRILYTSAVAALTLGITAALTYPAVAGQRPDATTDAAIAAGVSPQVFQALSRDLKLDAKGVQLRLANEAKAAGADLKLRKALGASYSGAWLSADAKTFTVAVSNAAQAEQVKAAGATPQVVKLSLAQLDAAKAKLDAVAAKAPKSVPGWYVDVTTNSVVVLAHAGGDAASFIKASGIDAGAVRVEASTERPVPYIDVIGGNAYYIGGSRCSVGFPVVGGFVTAGHCGTTGSTTTQPSGTFRGSSFPGNDYAWVQVASGNTPRPYVNNYSGGNVTVAGSTEAAVGASVCRSGSTTGWHCGTIQARGASVTYSQGTVTGLIRTNVCAEPGDSGGSLIAGSQAQGVTSGGSGNCSSGGTTYFQPVNEILQAYSLTLMTSGTTPPSNPPTTGCTGYEFTRSGSLSSGASAYQPDNSYYTSTASGTHRGCLAGPSGTDYDLYLQKWNGSAWVVVAQGATSSSSETLTYSGTAGSYRYRVHAYSGSGSYTMGFTNP